MGDTKNVEYFPLTPENFDEVVDLFDKEFFPREPLSMGVKMEATISSGIYGKELKKCLSSGVSFGARDPSTGILIGGRLCYVKTKGEKPSENLAVEKVTEFEKKVTPILAEVTSKVDVFQDPGVGKMNYMFMLCVRPQYGGRGIARKLVELSMDRAKALGCQIAFTTITNVLSGRVFTKLGFETRFTLDMSRPEGDRGLDLNAMNGNHLIHIMTKRL